MFTYVKHVISLFVFFIRKNRRLHQQALLCADMLDSVYADSLPSKPEFYCLSEVLDALHSNSVLYHKHTGVMLNRLHR